MNFTLLDRVKEHFSILVIKGSINKNRAFYNICTFLGDLESI